MTRSELDTGNMDWPCASAEITGNGVGRLKRPWLAGYLGPMRWQRTGIKMRWTRWAFSTPGGSELPVDANVRLAAHSSPNMRGWPHTRPRRSRSCRHPRGVTRQAAWVV